MRFRILDTIICVTPPVTESTMTTVAVFRHAHVPIKVNGDNDDIFRRFLCCFLIKQALKLILGLKPFPQPNQPTGQLSDGWQWSIADTRERKNDRPSPQSCPEPECDAPPRF
ncbi:unnamed protein product [Heligmosomoides polygyrus]|uniref:Secreted protein n=1 Tax=Heligmosomoides polygyrus TaxID=6339 RepID=A0A3P7YPD5_HELPZ|nr:unnamed protein product [Heligmosomoides polygyrus]